MERQGNDIEALFNNTQNTYFLAVDPDEERRNAYLKRLGDEVTLLNTPLKSTSSLTPLKSCTGSATDDSAKSKTCQEVAVDNTPSPPQYAERIFYLLLLKRHGDVMPGDLEEEYRELVSKFSVRFANLWYWEQVILSAWPLLRVLIRGALLALFGNWVRRYIS